MLTAWTICCLSEISLITEEIKENLAIWKFPFTSQGTTDALWFHNKSSFFRRINVIYNQPSLPHCATQIQSNHMKMYWSVKVNSDELKFKKPLTLDLKCSYALYVNTGSLQFQLHVCFAENGSNMGAACLEIHTYMPYPCHAVSHYVWTTTSGCFLRASLV